MLTREAELRRQCQEISAKTAPLIDIFMKAIEDPEELKKMEGTDDFAEEMRKLENLIREREDRHFDS